VKAILPVHLYGFPAAMEEICDIASERGIAVVEDACQAHGARRRGKMVGSFKDAGCFSFFPSKNMMVGGDGGMVVTDDDLIAENVASLRDCGRVKDARYVHSRIGFTARLNTVQAAIGRIQLKRLDVWNEKRRLIARKYDELLSDMGEIITPPRGNNDIRPVYHMYAIRSNTRDDLRIWLRQAGVECGVHYPYPIHLQPVYRELFGYKGGEFPSSETLCRETLSIPMYPGLTDDEVKFISEKIHAFNGR
jgi:dTDP-4-amino-4,6-dideoxygalactose transaminase